MDSDLDCAREIDNIMRNVFRGNPAGPTPNAYQVPVAPFSGVQSTTPASCSAPSFSISAAASVSVLAAAPVSTGTALAFAAPSRPRSRPAPRSDPRPRLRSRPRAALAKKPRPSPPRSSFSTPFVRRGTAVNAPAPGLMEELGKGPSVDGRLPACLDLPPDLDMSTAIALSQKLSNVRKRSYSSAFGWDDDHGYRPYELAFSAEETICYYPRQYISMEDACRIPDKPLRDELVRLYFMHFHPFCPVVNEIDFMDIYDNVDDDEQLRKRIDLTLFQAMMFVAFGHLPLSRLRRTPYKSIPEGQKAFFEKASVLYHMNYTLDHLSMTKVALLFTYWHPFDSETQVNNYWVDRAFSHARAIKLWEWKHDEEDSSSRRRIVWWCCLLRDRLVSIALRRPNRIQEARSTWPVVDLADFGLEAMFPKFTDVKAKRAVIEAFIWLCKLSNILRDVAVFHEKNYFARSWCGVGMDKDAIMPELNQVSQFDARLNDWKEGYLETNGDCIRSPRPSASKMPNYVMIINDSAIASLYLPYIYYPTGSILIAQEFRRVALGKIKSASSMVALQVRKLNSSGVVGEDMAVGIVGWIALPMAVFKVLSDTNGSVPAPHNSPNTGRYADFVPFLASLATRFDAAKTLSGLMGKATGEIVEKSIELGLARINKTQSCQPPEAVVPKLSKESDTSTGRAEAPAATSRARGVDEAETLDCISKMVDLHLSTNE